MFKAASKVEPSALSWPPILAPFKSTVSWKAERSNERIFPIART